MKLKSNFKMLLVFGIIFVAFLLFNTGAVLATEVNDYKCKIEKDGYILYNNYFNTEDVKVSIQDNTIIFNKENIEKTIFNNLVEDIKSEKVNKLLVQISNEVSSVKLEDTTEDLEIVEQNGKKYVVIDVILTDFQTDYEIVTYNGYTLEINKNGTLENKNIGLDFYLKSTDYFICTTNIVDSNGRIYGTNYDTNGYMNGEGLVELPTNIDLSKMYVEILANQYMGETIQVDTLGTANYVGKYGNVYKYKVSLKNIKVEYDSFALKFNYKNNEYMTGFWIDKNYIVDNETYVEQTETNKDTKLKFDLQGKFSGTVKAEEVTKNDTIYNKVNEELKKYSKNNIYMNISNIYIENGSYEGPIKLTFYVGEQYNEKYYSIVHMKNEKYEFEEFEGIVKEGKVEITVDSLSPFGISIFEKVEEDTDNNTDVGVDTDNNDNVDTNTDTNNNTNTNTSNSNKGEKDETPKTGTVDIIGYVSIVTLISLVGIVVLKKKLK